MMPELEVGLMYIWPKLSTPAITLLLEPAKLDITTLSWPLLPLAVITLCQVPPPVLGLHVFEQLV